MQFHKVLALGCFDMFHVGHLRYLQKAKEFGNYLIVGVAPYSSSLKNKNRVPIIELSQRMEIVVALKCVDEVVEVPIELKYTKEASKWISELGVSTVVSGDEWENTTKWNSLIDELKNYNIIVKFTPTTKNISTTIIREKIKSTI